MVGSIYTPPPQPATSTTTVEQIEYDADGKVVRRTVTTTTWKAEQTPSQWWQSPVMCGSGSVSY